MENAISKEKSEEIVHHEPRSLNELYHRISRCHHVFIKNNIIIIEFK